MINSISAVHSFPFFHNSTILVSMKYPHYLENLIQLFQSLPGVGGRTAERFAFHLLNWSPQQLEEMSQTVSNFREQKQRCAECGSLCDERGCHFCTLALRDTTQLCIVGSPKELFAVEATHEYQGLYHVVEGLLSPLDDRGPEVVQVERIQERIEKLGVEEVIIAFDSTIEGDATALYLKQELATEGLSVSRLAFGLPMGSALDYVDGGTLAQALSGRQVYR
jgi:recombination protein RecR